MQKEWIAKVDERNSNQPALGHSVRMTRDNKMMDTLADLNDWMVDPANWRNLLRVPTAVTEAAMPS